MVVLKVLKIYKTDNKYRKEFFVKTSALDVLRNEVLRLDNVERSIGFYEVSFSLKAIRITRCGGLLAFLGLV